MPNRWTERPIAAELLASCALNQPPTRARKSELAGHDTVYTSTVGPHADRRVAELRVMHAAAVAEAFAAFDRGEITREELRAIDAFDEQCAIREAVEGGLRAVAA